MAKSGNLKLEDVLKLISDAPLTGTPTSYHPSEHVNQNDYHYAQKTELCKNKDEKILDVINNYHIYCKLCKQHFYSCSKLNDINSFFQHHVNSVEHKWNRENFNWEKTKPILQWEKWLCTGFCALCNKSGIKAFIINTELDIVNIVGKHIEMRRLDKHDIKTTSTCDSVNEYAKKMAKLDLFSKIYVVQLPNTQYLCKVCCLLVEEEALLDYHLNSNRHFINFCNLLEGGCGTPLSKLVEVNIKELVGQMEKLKFKNSVGKKSKGLPYDTERKFFLAPEFGFHPSVLFMLDSYSVTDEELREAQYCFLCEQNPLDMDLHLSSNDHKLRVMVYNQCSAARPVTVFDYVSSNLSLLNVWKEKYEEYKLLLQKEGLDFGIPFKAEHENINLKSEFCDDGLIDDEIRTSIALIEAGFLNGKSSLKNLHTKEESNYKVVTAEKLSEKEMVELQSFFNPGFKKKLKAKKTSKIPDKGKGCKGSIEDIVDSLLERYIDSDLEFFHTVEKWHYLVSSGFVCVVCGFSCKKLRKFFLHFRTTEHIMHYEQFKSGKLVPISPTRYSIIDNRYFCRRCGGLIFEAKPKKFTIANLAISIKSHESESSETKTFSPAVSVDEKNAENLVVELKKILKIGHESEEEVNIPEATETVLPSAEKAPSESTQNRITK